MGLTVIGDESEKHYSIKSYSKYFRKLDESLIDIHYTGTAHRNHHYIKMIRIGIANFFENKDVPLDYHNNWERKITDCSITFF